MERSVFGRILGAWRTYAHNVLQFESHIIAMMGRTTYISLFFVSFLLFQCIVFRFLFLRNLIGVCVYIYVYIPFSPERESEGAVSVSH